jgi:hypothetical protein
VFWLCDGWFWKAKYIQGTKISGFVSTNSIVQGGTKPAYFWGQMLNKYGIKFILHTVLLDGSNVASKVRGELLRIGFANFDSTDKTNFLNMRISKELLTK